jgi:hypothetical protein
VLHDSHDSQQGTPARSCWNTAVFCNLVKAYYWLINQHSAHEVRRIFVGAAN